MLRSGKKITAVVLSAVMLLPCFAAGVSASGAEITGADVSGTGVQITSTMESTGSSSVGQYSLDQVNTSLLVTHTGKSSEVSNPDIAALGSEVSNPDIAALGSLMTDASVYEENLITLSCDSGLYDALGFSSQELSSQTASAATNPDHQNPLAGYTFMNPQEMMVGQSNRGDAHSTYFISKDNRKLTDPSELEGNLDDYPQNTETMHFNDDNSTWNNQESNGIGIDADGDGTDEFAYVTLAQKENDNDDMHRGSYVRIRLYDRVGKDNNGDGEPDAWVWQLVMRGFGSSSWNQTAGCTTTTTSTVTSPTTRAGATCRSRSATTTATARRIWRSTVRLRLTARKRTPRSTASRKTTTRGIISISAG